MLRTYYQLTKPGIIYGNLLTAVAGYLLGSRWHIDWSVFAGLLAGMSLVIASACVFNNYIDRNIDAKMARTKRRALVQDTVKGRDALIYATVLGILGSLILGLWVNALVIGIGLVAFIDYTVLYGFAKRRSVHGTLVGTVAGAAPVVAGYSAATGHLGTGALLLFLVLAFWQMPHFYAIATYRLKDYKAAGLPVWPAVRGLSSTKRQILMYVSAFIVANIALSMFGYTGYVYAAVMSLIGLYWLKLALEGFGVDNDRRWGRRMFLYSLIVILALSIMLAVGSLLP